jgi:uncharacterized membrane protein YgcG
VITLTPVQADDVRSALSLAERRSGLRFAVYVGRPIGPRRHFAERLHAALGEESPQAVLVLVDPHGRGVEIVTGERAGTLLPDAECRLAAMSMATSFSAGDLVGGLIGGIGALADHAATRH